MGCLLSCFQIIDENEPIKRVFSDILYLSDNSDEYEMFYFRNNND